MNTKTYLYRFCTSIRDSETKRIKRYIRRVKVIKLANNKYHLLCLKYEFEDPNAITLVRKIAYVFDEVIVELNSEMKITQLNNSKALQGRWEKTKLELLKNNSGKVVTDYIQSVNETIYNKERLAKFLETDKMYGLFFKSLWLKDNIEDLEQMEVTRKADNRTVIEQKDAVHKKYIYYNTLLKECFEIKNNRQYEILWLG